MLRKCSQNAEQTGGQRLPLLELQYEPKRYVLRKILPWAFGSKWIHEQKEDVGNSEDELKNKPVVVEVADEDRVEEPNAEGNLSKSCGEGSPLRADPLEENYKAHDVGSHSSSSDDHVADGEHEIVYREGSDNLSSEINFFSGCSVYKRTARIVKDRKSTSC